MILSNFLPLILLNFKLYNLQSFKSLIPLILYTCANPNHLLYHKNISFKVLKLVWIKSSLPALKRNVFFSKNNSLVIISRFVSLVVILNNLSRYSSLFKSNNIFNYLNSVTLLINSTHINSYKTIKTYKSNLRFNSFFNLFQFNNLVL